MKKAKKISAKIIKKFGKLSLLHKILAIIFLITNITYFYHKNLIFTMILNTSLVIYVRSKILKNRYVPPKQEEKKECEDHNNNEIGSCDTCPDPCEKKILKVPQQILNQIDMEKKLEGTSKNYDKHILLCTGKADWKGSTSNNLNTNAFKSKLKIISQNVNKSLLGSMCDVEVNQEKLFDIIILPDNKKIVGIEEDDFEDALISYLEHGKLPDNSLSKIIDLDAKHTILICSHMSKDQRCGVIAPLLLQQFEIELKEKKFEEKVSLIQVSHFGGHKFAGNIICYPDGNWYGRLIPEHVEKLVQSELIEKKVLAEFWRGSMSKKALGDLKW